MKTHTIKTPTAELMILEMPERASMLPVEIINGNTYISYSPAPFAPPTNLELLANGNWEVLGKTDEIREGDAAQLIPMYFDHEKTAVEYLIEMIESEIYWENPYGDSIPIFVEASPSAFKFCEREKQKWMEAEQKTFNRNRSIIFKRKI